MFSKKHLKLQTELSLLIKGIYSDDDKAFSVGVSTYTMSKSFNRKSKLYSYRCLWTATKRNLKVLRILV